MLFSAKMFFSPRCLLFFAKMFSFRQDVFFLPRCFFSPICFFLANMTSALSSITAFWGRCLLLHPIGPIGRLARMNHWRISASSFSAVSWEEEFCRVAKVALAICENSPRQHRQFIPVVKPTSNLLCLRNDVWGYLERSCRWSSLDAI